MMRITLRKSSTDGWRRLLRQANRPVWVKSAVLTIGRLLPVSPAKRTFSETVSMSHVANAQEQTLDSSSARASIHFDHHRKRARGLSAIFLRRVRIRPRVAARDDKRLVNAVC